MFPNKPGLWANAAAIARLIELWNQEPKLSTLEISRVIFREFHTFVSKNAILGKVHRLGLEPRASPIHNADGTTRIVAPRKVQPMPQNIPPPKPMRTKKEMNLAVRPVILAPVAPAPRLPPKLDEVPMIWQPIGQTAVITTPQFGRECQWIDGTTQQPISWCSAPVHEYGKAYCAAHHSRSLGLPWHRRDAA